MSLLTIMFIFTVLLLIVPLIWGHFFDNSGYMAGLNTMFMYIPVLFILMVTWICYGIWGKV